MSTLKWSAVIPYFVSGVSEFVNIIGRIELVA